MMPLLQFSGSAVGSGTSSSELKLMVIGLSRTERSMVEAVARLSRRRQPSLAIVDGSSAVDIFIVDANDLVSMQSWRLEAAKGKGTCALLIDGVANGAGQLGVPRPVQWSLLPAIIAQAMQGGLPVAQETPAAPARPQNSQQSADAQSVWQVQKPEGLGKEGVGTFTQGLSVAQVIPSQPKSLAINPGTDILVVDDSLPIRNFMQAALRPSNLRIVFAENGEQALEMAQKQAFACIFLDVVMPGIDGYQVCRAIKSAKQLYGKPTVVMLTSKSSPFDKIRGAMSGCNAYLTKPVERDRLLELIAKFVPASHWVSSM